MANDNQAGNQPKRKTMNSSTRDPIGAALKRLHDDVVSEPVPDEFLQLLSDIDRKIDKGMER